MSNQQQQNLSFGYATQQPASETKLQSNVMEQQQVGVGNIQKEVATFQQQQQQQQEAVKTTIKTTVSEERVVESMSPSATAQTVSIAPQVETVLEEQLTSPVINELRFKREEAKLAYSQNFAAIGAIKKDLQEHLQKAEESLQLEKKEIQQIDEFMAKERELERQRMEAHNNAQAHEQERAKAQALREAFEYEVVRDQDEILRHELAAEKAKALEGVFDLELQEAMARLRLEQFEIKHSAILSANVGAGLVPEHTVVAVVPSVIPEAHLQAHPNPKMVVVDIDESKTAAGQTAGAAGAVESVTFASEPSYFSSSSMSSQANVQNVGGRAAAIPPPPPPPPARTRVNISGPPKKQTGSGNRS